MEREVRITLDILGRGWGSPITAVVGSSRAEGLRQGSEPESTVIGCSQSQKRHNAESENADSVYDVKRHWTKDLVGLDNNRYAWQEHPISASDSRNHRKLSGHNTKSGKSSDSVMG